MRRSVIDFFFRHFSPGDYVLGLTQDEVGFMEAILEVHGYASSKVLVAKGEYEGQWAVRCGDAKPGAVPAPILLNNIIKE